MIKATENDDGILVLEDGEGAFACPLVTRGQIVCLGGKSEEEAIKAADLFRDHEEKLKKQAADLKEQAWICKQANLLERAAALSARAKKLDPEIDLDD